MKGFLGFLFLLSPVIIVLVWIGLTWLMFKGARRFLGSGFVPVGVRVVLIVVIAAAWFGWSFWEAGGKKLYWDAKVRELCAIDGGVRVYETVEFPAELYDYYSSRNWILPDKKQAQITDQYYFDREVVYYRRGNPQVTRTKTQIVSHSDLRVLGEAIRYGRGGGDFPGPWHGSSFSCSDISRPPSLAKSIFQRGEDNENND